MLYVIAYDVSDDGNRVRLAELLLDYGDRVQQSVFEADLDAETLQEVLARAAKYLAAEDSLRVYPLCRACRERQAVRGRPAPERPSGGVVA